MKTDKNYARCKACNTPFYPVWNKKLGTFEELCWRCLPIAVRAARTDCDLYKTSTSKWSEDSDLNFLMGYLSDIETSPHQDLLDDDPYHEYGDTSFGEMSLFDKYN